MRRRRRPPPRAAISSSPASAMDDDLRQVTTGPDGAFHAMAPGSVFIDNTTASAHVARDLQRIAADKGMRLRRRARFGRPGGRRKRRPDGDVRRHRGRLRQGRTGDPELRPHGQADRRPRRWSAVQDGQPRSASPALSRGLAEGIHFAHKADLDVAKRDGGDLQGRGAVLADGKPLGDNGQGRLRFRLRRRLDAQGHVDRPGGGARGTAPACQSRRWSTSSMPRSRRWGGNRWDTSSLIARLESD